MNIQEKIEWHKLIVAEANRKLKQLYPFRKNFINSRAKEIGIIHGPEEIEEEIEHWTNKKSESKSRLKELNT